MLVYCSFIIIIIVVVVVIGVILRERDIICMLHL